MQRITTLVSTTILSAYISSCDFNVDDSYEHRVKLTEYGSGIGDIFKGSKNTYIAVKQANKFDGLYIKNSLSIYKILGGTTSNKLEHIISGALLDDEMILCSSYSFYPYNIKRPGYFLVHYKIIADSWPILIASEHLLKASCSDLISLGKYIIFNSSLDRSIYYINPKIDLNNKLLLGYTALQSTNIKRLRVNHDTGTIYVESNGTANKTKLISMKSIKGIPYGYTKTIDIKYNDTENTDAYKIEDFIVNGLYRDNFYFLVKNTLNNKCYIYSGKIIYKDEIYTNRIDEIKDSARCSKATILNNRYLYIYSNKTTQVDGIDIYSYGLPV